MVQVAMSSTLELNTKLGNVVVMSLHIGHQVSCQQETTAFVLAYMIL